MPLVQMVAGPCAAFAHDVSNCRAELLCQQASMVVCGQTMVMWQGAYVELRPVAAL